MSVREFRLPDLGEGLTEAEIIAWQVVAGDHVVQDQPMVSVETAKAVTDIPAPWSGRVVACYGEVGDVVEVGKPLVAIDTRQAVESRSVVGQLATGDSPGPHGGAGISPRLRQYARARQVDPEQLQGSGPGGAITTADIDRACPATPTPAIGASAIRREMARTMECAWREVAHAGLTDHADVSHWSGHNVLARLVRALLAGCRQQPALNARYDAEHRTLEMQQPIHLGIAVDSEQGLLVPVLRDAGSLPPAELEPVIGQLVTSARAGRLSADQMQGATITLSNFGSIAGRWGQMIVVPPQVAIIGAGRIEPWPVLDKGQWVERARLPLSLSFDHRAVSGGEAARFMRALIQSIETNPT